eukprot:s1356_g5.t1
MRAWFQIPSSLRIIDRISGRRPLGRDAAACGRRLEFYELRLLFANAMMFAMAENTRAQDAQRRASNYARAAKRALKKGAVDQSNTSVAATVLNKKIRRMNANENLPDHEETVFPEGTFFPEEATVLAETMVPSAAGDQLTCLDEASTVVQDWTGYVPTDASLTDDDGQGEPTK